MFCPQCRSEFREGFSRCQSCDVDLVEEKDLPFEEALKNFTPDLSKDSDADNVRKWTQEGECPPGSVKVFESSDPFLVTTVGNLLYDNNIPFYVQNGEMGDVFPSAIFGSGGHRAVDPAQFLVLQDREAEARALLEDFLTIPADGNREFSDLPPELAQATDEPDPESEYEPTDNEADQASERKTIFCPNCGTEMKPTEGDYLARKHPCNACGKTVELD